MTAALSVAGASWVALVCTPQCVLVEGETCEPFIEGYADSAPLVVSYSAADDEHIRDIVVITEDGSQERGHWQSSITDGAITLERETRAQFTKLHFIAPSQNAEELQLTQTSGIRTSHVPFFPAVQFGCTVRQTERVGA